MVTGKTISNTGSATSPGKMEDSIGADMSATSAKVTGFSLGKYITDSNTKLIIGLTVVSTTEDGSKGASTASQYTRKPMAKSNVESGIKANGSATGYQLTVTG